VTKVYRGQEKKEEYLLVDGYNVIFAWEDLKELAQVNLDGARGKLMDILCNYQAIRRCNLILVFDAYRLKGHPVETLDYHNIHVVYTKEAETADRYIEKFAHDNSRKYDITVATSDGLEQIIIRGQGCRLLSSRDLREEIQRAENYLWESYPYQRSQNT
jgi:predicted RNA-binding protein with PIN domain